MLLLLSGVCLQGQSILREVWEGIPGTAVADLTGSADYPDNPTSTNLVTDYFEAPVDVLEDYGQRMHGYVVPPVTGNYTFWISSDDGSELWLSTDSSPANKRLIASVTGWTPSREWGWEANQQSAAIRLEAGQAYYVAALQKEGGGGDNLAVRWLRPDGVDEGPIPATHLLPYGIAFTPPIIIAQPTNTAVIEGQYATFRVQVSNVDLVSCRWQRNETFLPGATALTLNFGPVRMTDQNARFRAILTNNLGGVTSDTATLSVVPDTVAPVLESARNEGQTRVVVRFSEAMAGTTALDPANYTLDQGHAITAATYGADQATVLLTTSPLTYGGTYTLTANNITDQAAAANPIAPDSQITFTAHEYAPSDIGSPTLPGNTVSVPGGVDVTGGGKTIGGTSDQFQFGWQEREGDFDLEVRVAGVTVPDPFVHAGLMARESLEANSRFGAVFASSAQLGCFFESRLTTGASSATAAPRGGFPANYPHTWLRLQRAGATLHGYTSLNGQTWTALGSASLAGLPTRIYVGLAVSSDGASTTATARFRDLGPTRNPTVGTVRFSKEPVGPSSRATGMIISEIMYHPAPSPDGRNLEFVEVHNARSIFEDLTGWRISGDIDYTFPDGFRLNAGETVVIAAAPEDVIAAYGIANVLGPYTGALPNDSGQVRLRNNADAIRLEVEYSDDPPWPAAADGAGHSLVLARPSYGENSVHAWAASEFRGGSPGELDPTVPTPEANVLINEFLAHTDDPVFDFIELYNRSNQAVDLSGCVLTDDAQTNRFRIPDGTVLEPRGFLSWDQNQLGFALSASGETIFLVSSNGDRVLDAIRFGGQENGVASGRSPDGANAIRRLLAPTPGAANAPWRSEPVVINEVMYHPISKSDDDEYLELHNQGGAAVDVGGWRFVEGIDFTLPANTSIPAGGYLVVARNAARLLTNYSHLTAANTVGDYNGSLANNGERIALAKPDFVVSTNALGVTETNVIHIVVSEVTYADGGRWGRYADGGGSSLELVDPRADLLRPSNWADSDETAKAVWTGVEFTGRIDNASGTANRLHIGLLGAGECLVDDVEAFRTGSTNVVTRGTFEDGTTGWVFSGNHSTSTVDTSGAATGTRCLHVRAGGDGDTGPNSLRTTLSPSLPGNATVTIRANVRWLAGWPQILFRLHGNGAELAANMTVPTNLGTPGLPNSRRVANAGPAIDNVAHFPPLPNASEQVRVTCNLSDPDGVALARLQYRVDPATTLTTVNLRDDGLQGDEIAGDGLYSALIPGQTTGRLVAFRITATDGAGASVSSVFPALAPAEECLVRWGEAIPFGTLAHYHLWFTQATASARRNALDNTYRDSTLVYRHHRVIYNTGFRDKGSPYHGGSGDIAATTPPDDPLLGTSDRVFASTGNGGSEATGIRSQLAAWYAQQLGIPYLHAHYMRLYFNGSLFRPDIMEDLEQPNHDSARRWFPTADEGDLYKISVWFEFSDDNQNFQATSATIQRFTTLGGDYKLARYRWNWQRRSNDGDANNYGQFLDLVTAVNDTSTAYVPNVLNLADMEQWMRVFGHDFAMGNWDAWTYNVGQNMFLYRPEGERWVLMPWDIDFVFGLGDGTSGTLRSGQDSVMNRAYSNPTFLRMNWRAYLDTVNGPFLAQNFQPQIDARRSILVKNAVSGITDPRSIVSWINSRRTYILNQLNAADAKTFEITTNSGNDYDATTPTVALDGTAPFAVATIEINGVPYPVTWTTARNFRLSVPLTQVTNTIALVGKDLRGNPVPGASDSIVVRYTGAIEHVQDFVVINEVHYDPAPSEAGSSFIELHNRSTVTAFDLSGFRLEGVDYTFPPGSILPPLAYAILVSDRARFEATYGGAIPVLDVFPGGLDNDGERLALVRPATPPEPDLVVSDLRYWNRPPWPTNAADLGPSLQLVDAAQGSWRVGNWTATATNDLNRTTPARANATVQSLTPFPALWINEVQPNNISSVTDRAGDRDPWIELYNAGTSTLDLSTFYLTPNYSNLNQWAFPAGTTLGPGQFLVIWVDGEPAESAPGEPHASFRLDPTTGAVALCRLQGTPQAAAVIDFAEYTQLSAGRSVGSFPDGEPRRRRQFVYVTPGAANDPAWPPVAVFINELQAGNTRTLADPADNDFDDWFELYNAGTNAVDLSGFTLTDDLDDPTKYGIPPGTTLPAGGFLLVWADEETGQNAGQDLHVNFKLALAGEELALFAPDNTLIDGLQFGPQTNDVSLGRYPDGADLPLYEMTAATPRAPNYMAGGNRPPLFGAIANQAVDEGTLLAFTVQATDPDDGQTVSYSLGADAPSAAFLDPQTGEFRWTPTEADGPGQHTFSVRATDNGTPVRTSSAQVQVDVAELNLPPSLEPVPDQLAEEGTQLAVQLVATDPDLPPNTLTFKLAPGAPPDATLTEDGQLTWTPDESMGDNIIPISIWVSDDGTPPMSALRTFSVLVFEVPNPPLMPFIPPQSVDEGTLFQWPVAATDPDTPPSPLRFTLETAPPGAHIDPATGLISWLPNEDDGPGIAIFVVRATELQPPYDSTTRTFSVGVSEVNQPPALAPFPPQTVPAGQVLAARAQATDPDRPAQALSFSLVAGAPPGATIDPDTGWVFWPVDPDHDPSTNHILVRVTDDGPGTLSATQTLEVVVVPQPQLVLNEIMYRPTTPGTEFIEILNRSSHTTESLDNVALTGNNLSFAFPAGIRLDPGQFLLVVANPTAFEAAYGTDAPVAGAWTGTLGATGDTLRLVRQTPGSNLEVLDEVSYSSSAPWPAAANGGGGSLQLIDPMQDNTRVGNWSAVTTLTATEPATVLPMTNLWRYHQAGQDLGTAWRDPSYNDASWPAGDALLYVENADLAAPKNTPLDLGPMTFYFRARFQYSGPTLGTRLTAYTILDDAAVVYLNGQELMRPGFNQGTEVTFDTPADRTVGDAVLEGPSVIESDLLRVGENVVAAEVHQNSTGSSDIVWGMDLQVEATAEPATPGRPNSLATSLPPFPPLWLNELLTLNATGILDNAGEREPWIELVNAGPLPVTLDGCYLTDSPTDLTRWAFPPGSTLEGGEFRILWADGEPGETAGGSMHTGFRLSNNRPLWLVRTQPTGLAVVDHLDVPTLVADTSVGSLPDAQAFTRTTFTLPTPGAPNAAVPIPEIEDVHVATGGGIEFSWAAVPGVRYCIEASTTLSAPDWQPVTEAVAQTGRLTFTDNPAEVTRFYRVVVP